MYHDEREINAEHTIERLQAELQASTEIPEAARFLVMLFVVTRIAGSVHSSDVIELMHESGFKSIKTNRLGRLIIKAKRMIDSEDEVNYLITHLIAVLISRRLGIDYRHPKLVAALVGTVQSTLSTPLLELMPNTAELSLGLLGAGPKKSFSMLGNNDSYLRKLIRIRLAVENVSARFVAPTAYRRFSQSTFVLDAAYVDPMRMLDTLQDAMENGGRGRFVLIQNWTRANTSGVWKGLLAVIEGLAQIEAVINFSSLPAALDHCTAIIIDTRLPQGDTLYIDVTLSNKSLPPLDSIERMLLAGCIYNLWQGRASHRSEDYLSSGVARFINSYFRDGFKPIIGLCNVMDKRPTAILKKRLVSRQFLEAAPDDFSRRTLTDNSKLISDRLVQCDGCCCIYVIGNNGEGKSFLLSDVVYRLEKTQNRSIGLPMSHADRFPRADDAIKPFFEYKGARTTRIVKDVGVIAQSPNKVSLFIECLGLIGFGLQTFLILKSGPSLDSNNNRGRDRLDLASIEDMDYLNSEKGLINAYTVNFVREQHRTIAFENLSSGEQSILSLLVKIIASNATGATFLIDEPEISLHVSWQQRLPRILSLLSSRLNASFVVATHSPVLIANAAEEDICYVSNIGKLKEIPVDERHSVETLLMDGFETYTPHNREVHERCAKLVAELILAANTSNVAGPAKEATDKLNEFEATILKNGRDDGNKRQASDLDLVRKTLGAVSMLLKQSEFRHG